MPLCREGAYSKDRIPVLTHAMDIPARLKELSAGYFVMYNTKSARFELHDSAQPLSTLACVLPFDELDARAIAHARKYHISRLSQTVNEIEAENERLERESELRLKARATDKLTEAFRYLKNNSKTDLIPKELIDE